MQNYSWQHYRTYQRLHVLPTEWATWLLAPGSFMQRLRQNAIAQPTVRVLSQRWALLPQEERQRLAVPVRQYGLVREVLIDSPEGQWMFARTVLPLATLTGKERRLGCLKSRSLGSVLFKDPRVRRGDFEITRIMPKSERHRQIKEITCIHEQALWARRSVFYIQHKTLLLTEIFLPAMQTLFR